MPFLIFEFFFWRRELCPKLLPSVHKSNRVTGRSEITLKYSRGAIPSKYVIHTTGWYHFCLSKPNVSLQKQVTNRMCHFWSTVFINEHVSLPEPQFQSGITFYPISKHYLPKLTLKMIKTSIKTLRLKNMKHTCCCFQKFKVTSQLANHRWDYNRWDSKTVKPTRAIFIYKQWKK